MVKSIDKLFMKNVWNQARWYAIFTTIKTDYWVFYDGYRVRLAIERTFNSGASSLVESLPKGAKLTYIYKHVPDYHDGFEWKAMKELNPIIDEFNKKNKEWNIDTLQLFEQYYKNKFIKY